VIWCLFVMNRNDGPWKALEDERADGEGDTRHDAAMA
jgi:hypothetical protein